LISVCLLVLGVGSARAQPGALLRVTELASVTTGSIQGVVLDEGGRPLDGVVVSALGGATAFAVTDRGGNYSLRALPPGPYLLRAHLVGYLPGRSTMVDVRPAGRTNSSFTLRREGTAAEPAVAEATVGVAQGEAYPATTAEGRDESETAWRLRHLRRPILKEATAMAVATADEDEWFLANSVEYLGRAVESSARLATALFADDAVRGQVNLLTTGAFDTPAELLQLDRTRSVAYFSVGAPVGGHGDWLVRAALNQGDLSSWILAGNYVVRAPATHRYTVGMSYGLQRYEGGNALALAAVSDAARNVGSMFGYDEWALSRFVTLGYGASYAHYDYLEGPALFSPRVGATFAITARTRLRALAARDLSAPGREEFLPPSRAEFVPPQRTFSPLSPAGFRTQEIQHYELALERVMNEVTVGVRAFRQDVNDQMATLFGVRTPDTPAATLGHYFVATAGDVTVRGVGLTVTHALAENVRGSVDYSLSAATWTDLPPPADLAMLNALVPSLVRRDVERVHDLSTSVETEIAPTATRVFVLYRLSNAFVDADGGGRSGLDTRFDLQVNQRLPFRNFLSADWEALVAVRNVFRESALDQSVYDELLVVRPPKRIIGGLTVKF
jgi:hypothetical protein